MPDLAHVILELPVSGLVTLLQGFQRTPIGQREIRTFLGAKEQDAGAGIIEKGAVMACRNNGAVTGQGGKEALERADPANVEMVRRLIEQ
jgi:hypothetical protein